MSINPEIPGTATEQKRANLTHNFKLWSQKDLHVISCIKEQPCLYKPARRSPRIYATRKRAWEMIQADLAVHYKGVTVSSLRKKWDKIRDCYKEARKTAENYNTEAYNKYLDGTLSFIDNAKDFEDQNDNDTIEQFNRNEEDQEISKVHKNVNAGLGKLSVNALQSSSPEYKDSNIRQLHEELDVIGDDDIDIKLEYEEDTDDNNYIATLEAMMHPNNDNKEKTTAKNKKDPPQKKWDAEELLNATRLTQEMIEELIIIKQNAL